MLASLGMLTYALLAHWKKWNPLADLFFFQLVSACILCDIFALTLLYRASQIEAAFNETVDELERNGLQNLTLETYKKHFFAPPSEPVRANEKCGVKHFTLHPIYPLIVTHWKLRYKGLLFYNLFQVDGGVFYRLLGATFLQGLYLAVTLLWDLASTGSDDEI